MNTEELSDILPGDLEINKTQDGLLIDFTDEYEAPEISFERLKKLSEFFGTDKVDVVDKIARGGCETCDYGSAYGHQIKVLNPTKNVPEAPTTEL